MKNLWRIITRRVHLSFIDRLDDTVRSLGSSGRTLFIFFAVLLTISAAGLAYLVQSEVVVASPTRGGTYSEGIVGTPRFINPILAISDADRDLTALMYSGLLRPTAEGNYVADLAESYSVDESGKEYTVKIRPTATFHDNSPVTAEDVVFTVHKAQDPAIKSPMRANWDGVTVEALDPQTVRFTLRNAYSPFIENLTLGILPSVLWDSVSDEEFPFSDLNISPIGSGPFEMGSIARGSGGVPTHYTLRSFADYALGEPYLSSFTIRFYQNEQELLAALKSGDVEAASGISPAALEDLHSGNTTRSPLNRVFAVFFNQNQSEVLRDRDVRSALASSIDQAALVEQVLQGYGTPLQGPVSPKLLGQPVMTATSTDLAAAAQARLIARGWKIGENGILQKTTGTGTKAKTTTLTFDLATGDVAELRAAAEYVRAQWEKVGIDAQIKIFESGDLAQNVIRPRKFDALLFGEVVGRELDLFAFWHSSQRNDPGLNVAGYANAAADRALDNLRTATPQMRLSHIEAFLSELAKDIPAAFLYAPDFVYSVPNDLAGLDLGLVETPSDRFLSVAKWHKETDYVWPIFARQDR